MKKQKENKRIELELEFNDGQKIIFVLPITIEAEISPLPLDNHKKNGGSRK